MLLSMGRKHLTSTRRMVTTDRPNPYKRRWIMSESPSIYWRRDRKYHQAISSVGIWCEVWRIQTQIESGSGWSYGRCASVPDVRILIVAAWTISREETLNSGFGFCGKSRMEIPRNLFLNVTASCHYRTSHCCWRHGSDVTVYVMTC
jgi:hypothetical protein